MITIRLDAVQATGLLNMLDLALASSEMTRAVISARPLDSPEVLALVRSVRAMREVRDTIAAAVASPSDHGGYVALVGDLGGGFSAFGPYPDENSAAEIHEDADSIMPIFKRSRVDE